MLFFFCFKLGFTGFLPPRDIEKGSARNVSGYCLKETRRVSIKKAWNKKRKKPKKRIEKRRAGPFSRLGRRLGFGRSRGAVVSILHASRSFTRRLRLPFGRSLGPTFFFFFFVSFYRTFGHRSWVALERCAGNERNLFLSYFTEKKQTNKDSVRETIEIARPCRWKKTNQTIDSTQFYWILLNFLVFSLLFFDFPSLFFSLNEFPGAFYLFIFFSICFRGHGRLKMRIAESQLTIVLRRKRERKTCRLNANRARHKRKRTQQTKWRMSLRQGRCVAVAMTTTVFQDGVGPNELPFLALNFPLQVAHCFPRNLENPLQNGRILRLSDFNPEDPIFNGHTRSNNLGRTDVKWLKLVSLISNPVKRENIYEDQEWKKMIQQTWCPPPKKNSKAEKKTR